MTYLNELLQKPMSNLDRSPIFGTGLSEEMARNIADFILKEAPSEFVDCLGCPKALNMVKLEHFYNEMADATENQCDCEDITCQQFQTWVHANYENEYVELINFAYAKEHLAYE